MFIQAPLFAAFLLPGGEVNNVKKREPITAQLLHPGSFHSVTAPTFSCGTLW